MDTQDPKLWGQYFQSLLLIKAELLYSHVPLKQQLNIQECVLLSQKNLICCVPPPNLPLPAPRSHSLPSYCLPGRG